MYKNKLAYTTASTNSIINAVGTITSYTYSSSSWGDLLTKYGGTSIAYDEIGNPTNWRNASLLTWNGRTLKSITLTNGSTLSFEYNTAGIRTRKSVDASGTTTEYTYILDGTKVVAERKSGSVFIEYFYDDTGSVVGCKYGTQEYYFQKNLQGDIIRIVNSIGVIVVEYTYDAWGNILSITGSSADTVGQANSFRYRGYFYDNETGLYYLNSRYYDPTVGRFLNADGIIADVSGSIQGYNMFTYCFNNPVNMLDSSGYWPGWLDELGSRFLHTVKIMGRILVSPFKAISVEVGVGVGLGVKAKAVVNNVDIELNAVSSITDSISYDKGKFDVRNSTSTDVGINVAGIYDLTRSYKRTHSYFDDQCTCDFMSSTFEQKMNCSANQSNVSNESILGFSFGGYLLVGGEVSVALDLNAWNEELISIYNESMAYGK